MRVMIQACLLSYTSYQQPMDASTVLVYERGVLLESIEFLSILPSLVLTLEDILIDIKYQILFIYFFAISIVLF